MDRPWPVFSRGKPDRSKPAVPQACAFVRDVQVDECWLVSSRAKVKWAKAVVTGVARWCVGSLVRWIVGSLGRWAVGPLDRWAVGSLDRPGITRLAAFYLPVSLTVRESSSVPGKRATHSTEVSPASHAFSVGTMG